MCITKRKKEEKKKETPLIQLSKACEKRIGKVDGNRIKIKKSARNGGFRYKGKRKKTLQRRNVYNEDTEIVETAQRNSIREAMKGQLAPWEIYGKGETKTKFVGTRRNKLNSKDCEEREVKK